MILVLNQSPISAVFAIVRFAGNQKTALTGESLYFLPLTNHNITIFRDANSKVWFHPELISWPSWPRSYWMTPNSIFFSDHNGRRTNWGHSWNKHGTNGCYVSSKYSKNFSKTYVIPLLSEYLVSNLSTTFIWNKFVFMFIER